MYIDSPKELVPLINLWANGSIPNLTLGRSVQGILSGINEHTGMILINLLDYIDKDENGRLESGSNFLVNSIREHLEQSPRTCFIFGGPGEVELFGGENVITESLSRWWLLKIIDEIKKRLALASLFGYIQPYYLLLHHSDPLCDNPDPEDWSSQQREAEQYPCRDGG